MSIHETSGVTLRGSAVARTSLGEYASAFGLGGEREKAVAAMAAATAATAAAELPVSKRAAFV